MISGNFPPADVLNRIYEIADKASAHVVVAGGAAVDYLRASDIDVFVFGSAFAAIRFRDELAQAQADQVSYFWNDRSENQMPYEGGHADDFYRLGSGNPVWTDDKTLHVIGYTKSDSVEDLLETFDLSVHAWALARMPSGQYQRLGCAYSTHPGDPIRVMQDTSTTPARLVKLSKRYHPCSRGTYGDPKLTRSETSGYRTGAQS